VILGFMDVLEIEQAHLVGHSLGGAVAISMAIGWPSRAALAHLDRERRTSARKSMANIFPASSPRDVEGDLKSVVARLFQLRYVHL